MIQFTDLLTGEKGCAEYDKLIIATGATPRKPPIPGIELEGITSLQSLPDADYLRKVRDEGTIKNAVVIGGGLIGIVGVVQRGFEIFEHWPKACNSHIASSLSRQQKFRRYLFQC